MRMNDLHSLSDSANPYQSPSAEAASPKHRIAQSRIGIASFAFAVVDAVAVIALMGGSRRVVDLSIKWTMVATALGVTTGIASLFVRSRRCTFGIFGLIVSGTIGIGLVAFILLISTALRV